MFICENCHKQVAEKTPQHTIPIKTRKKHYPKRMSGKGNVVDNGGDGFETVRELRVCTKCNDTLTAAVCRRPD